MIKLCGSERLNPYEPPPCWLRLDLNGHGNHNDNYESHKSQREQKSRQEIAGNQCRVPARLEKLSGFSPIPDFFKNQFPLVPDFFKFRYRSGQDYISKTYDLWFTLRVP